MRTTTDYYHDYYSQLNGATILSYNGLVGNEDDYLTLFPSFTVRLPGGQITDIEISQDPEGNGGGFLFGLADPSPADGGSK